MRLQGTSRGAVGVEATDAPIDLRALHQGFGDLGFRVCGSRDLRFRDPTRHARREANGGPYMTFVHVGKNGLLWEFLPQHSSGKFGHFCGPTCWPIATLCCSIASAGAQTILMKPRVATTLQRFVA